MTHPGTASVWSSAFSPDPESGVNAELQTNLNPPAFRRED